MRCRYEGRIKNIVTKRDIQRRLSWTQRNFTPLVGGDTKWNWNETPSGMRCVCWNDIHGRMNVLGGMACMVGMRCALWDEMPNAMRCARWDQVAGGKRCVCWDKMLRG